MPNLAVAPNTEDQVISGLIQQLPPGSVDLEKARKTGAPNAAIIKWLQGRVAKKGTAPPPAPTSASSEYHPSGATRLGAGLIRSAGNALEESPIPTPSKAQGLWWAIQHPGEALKGMTAAQGKVFQEGVDLWKRGQYPGALAKFVYSGIPGVGPSLSKAGNEAASGDILGSFGTSLGVASNFFLPEMLPKTLTRPTRMFGKATGVTAPEASELLMNAGVSDAGGARKLLRGEDAKVTTALKNETARNVTPGSVHQEMAAMRGRYGAATDKAAIQKVEDEFLSELRTGKAKVGAVRNMSGQEAETLAQAQETSAVGKKPVEKAARLGVAKALRSTLENQFPELRTPYKNRYWLQQAIPEMDRAVVEAAKPKGWVKDALSMVAKEGIPSAIGYGMFGAPGSVAGFALGKMMSRPAVRAKLAIALSRAAGIPIPKAAVRLWGFANALKMGQQP